MLIPGRHYNSEKYRFAFNGKESDNEWKGTTGAVYDYGFRIYDSRVAKFLSVDPLTGAYPYYTPYQFAGNMPISAIDLEGLEPLMHWLIPPAKPTTPAGKISTDVAIKAKTFSSSRTGRVFKGVSNITFGTIGVVGSASYMIGTDGLGAALGGTYAMGMSFSQMAIGTAQIVDAFTNIETKMVKGNNILGVISHGMGFEYAKLSDAFGSLTTSFAVGGNIKNVAGITRAWKAFEKTPNLYNALSVYSSTMTAAGFISEGMDVLSEEINNAKDVKFNTSQTISTDENKKTQTISMNIDYSYVVGKGKNKELKKGTMTFTMTTKLEEQEDEK
jgi:RHS repeat-associated protein